MHGVGHNIEKEIYSILDAPFVVFATPTLEVFSNNKTL